VIQFISRYLSSRREACENDDKLPNRRELTHCKPTTLRSRGVAVILAPNVWALELFIRRLKKIALHVMNSEQRIDRQTDCESAGQALSDKSSAEEFQTYDVDEEIQFRQRVRLDEGFDDNCDAL
jgi:hypothetical protein